MTLDPSVQPTGEEVGGLTEAVKRRIDTIPEETKAEVRRCHHQLGHCSKQALLRLAKRAKKPEDHLFYIRHWKCPVCARRQRPGPAPTAGSHDKPSEFNCLVGVDLKEVLDADGTAHTYLNILDIATRFSCLVRVESKASQVVAQAFVDYWISWAGIPEKVIHDQGGEFIRYVANMLQAFGANPTVIATEAPWQNGLVERHGQVLGEIMSVMVDQLQLRGDELMATAGHFAGSAKNRRPDRTGHSARARVFGCAERLPGSVVDAIAEGENPTEMSEATRDPVMRRAVQMRTAAAEAPLRLDAYQRWSRLLASGVARPVHYWNPGAQVF